MRRSSLVPVAVVAVILGVACGSAKLVGAGGDCFVATDCDLGLACVPINGKSICTTDLSSIVSVPDAAVEAAQPIDGGADAPVDDAKQPDTSTQPDTSSQPDTSVTPDTSVPDTSIADTSSG